MKLKNKKMSIKWQLFIYLSIFTAATLLLLWFFQVVFLNSFYKFIKTSQIKLSAQSIAQNINSSDLQELVTNTARSDDMCIIVADEYGKVLYSEDVMMGCVIHRMSQQQFYNFVEHAEINNGSYLKRFNIGDIKNIHEGRGMIESIIYTKITEREDGSKIIIMLNANITPVNSTVQTIRIQLIFVTIIMLIFALILAFVISKKISKPIIKINSSSKELAEGNYNVHFDNDGYKEIAELGETLNYASCELSKTEKLRKELIANISHDLRTPLTMITGYAEIMRDLPGENVPENLQVVIDEAERLKTLVDDMLDISKLQAGVQKLNIKEYNFTQSVRDILKRYKKLIEMDDYNIKFVNDTDVVLKGDELKISQVIYNLVNNAVTYTGKDKKIMIRQTVNDNKVKLEVIDTGDGIPKDKLKDIWNRYYKVDKEHKRAQIGTGLGLSIVKTILDMHNAEYGVKSKMGEGSIFWFELKI